MLGKHGDGFTFGEVFGSRIWQRADYPAAALFVMRSNQALKVVENISHVSFERMHIYANWIHLLICTTYIYTMSTSFSSIVGRMQHLLLRDTLKQ